jgi:hypothetical protein
MKHFSVNLTSTPNHRFYSSLFTTVSNIEKLYLIFYMVFGATVIVESPIEKNRV